MLLKSLRYIYYREYAKRSMSKQDSIITWLYVLVAKVTPERWKKKYNSFFFFFLVLKNKKLTTRRHLVWDYFSFRVEGILIKKIYIISGNDDGYVKNWIALTYLRYQKVYDNRVECICAFWKYFESDSDFSNPSGSEKRIKFMTVLI